MGAERSWPAPAATAETRMATLVPGGDPTVDDAVEAPVTRLA